MDTIFISELKLDALIGIYAWEREVPQTLQLDIELAVDASRSAHSGRIGDTVDYAAVVKRVDDIVTSQHYALIEKLAEEVAATILSEFPTPWVRISIAKIAALRNVKKLGVVIERGTRPTA
jgi:dihydroneopterin aldolase